MNSRMLVTAWILVSAAALGAAAFSAQSLAQNILSPLEQLPGAVPSGSPSSAIPPGVIRDTRGSRPNCACVRPPESDATYTTNPRTDNSDPGPSTKGGRVSGSTSANTLGCTC